MMKPVLIPTDLQWQVGPLPKPSTPGEIVACWYDGCAHTEHKHPPFPPQIFTVVAQEEWMPDGSLSLEWVDERLITFGAKDFPEWAIDPLNDIEKPSYWASLGTLPEEFPDDRPTLPGIDSGNLPN